MSIGLISGSGADPRPHRSALNPFRFPAANPAFGFGAPDTEQLSRFKIAWLLAAPSPMQLALLEAAAQHPQIDLEVIVCARRIPGRTWDWNELNGRYKAQWLSGLRWRGFCLNPGIVRICTKNRYDLFVINHYDQPTGQLAMALLSLLRRPWAIAAERPGINPHSPIRNCLRWIALRWPKRHACCAIVTGRLASEAFANLFADGRPAYSVPYLFNLEPFLSIPVPEKRDGPIVFMYCGQLVPRKGIDVLCEAMRQVFESGACALLKIVGQGPEEKRVEELARRFDGRVRIEGYVPFDRRAEAYEDADVFVFPSRHDGWGMAVHEAMARGVPVISSRTVGAADELVKSGINGFLVNSNAPAEYARAMRFFVGNPGQITEFGRRARAAAMRLTPQWGVAQLLDIVERHRQSAPRVRPGS